jgi:hypothetical protein
MKRHGACSLRELGPCSGRTTPLPFGPARAEGRVDERTQVVDFPDICRYFLHVLMLGERDRPGRCGVRFAPRSCRKAKKMDVFGETPNKAVETTALPTCRISEYLRLLAFIRGATLQSLKVQNRLTQVVDFHDSFR